MIFYVTIATMIFSCVKIFLVIYIAYVLITSQDTYNIRTVLKKTMFLERNLDFLCFTYVAVETFKGPMSSKALSSVLKTQLHGPTTAPITVSVSIWKFSCIK